MIFKRFFKPKWQHADATVRQKAINELDANVQTNKTILHELAFNDGSEAVRKTALLKLNDFSLWWQASKHDSAERLQQLAEQTLINQLLQNEVEPKLKKQFIAQCNRSSILEQLAQTETDSDIKFSLLQRLNKTELNLKALQDEALSLEQKSELLSQIHDEKTLEKLTRQLSGDLLAQIEQKLLTLQEQKQKPITLRKNLTLLLSKLNALREKNTVEDVPAQLSALQQQWRSYECELHFLADEAQEYRQKYEKITTQLNNWLAPKLALLEQQAKVKAFEQEKAAKQQAFEQDLHYTEQAIAKTVQSASVPDTKVQDLDSLESSLNALLNKAATFDKKAAYIKRIEELKSQVSQLPLLAEQLNTLTILVSDLSALNVPSNAQEYQASVEVYQQLLKKWRDTAKAMTLNVPQELATAKRNIEQKWQDVAKSFDAEQDKVLRQCRSKLAQYRRLHGLGKFKVLFGLFKGIEEDYQQLSDNQKAQLTKDYDFASSTQKELADWQEYIATPRKQELLKQIQQLDSAIADSLARQRADDVKQARAVWKSLGKAAPGLEEELNAAFDKACEEAFAPCRAYFAAQDLLRSENVKEREALIESAKQHAQSNMDAKALESYINDTKNKWQQAGAVDKQQFVKLNEQFNQAISVLREQLKAHQQQALATKMMLIEKAQVALLQEDDSLTAKVLKGCQLEWKAAGTAPRKQEQQLWQQFRAICDGFFNERSAKYEAQKLAEKEQLQQFEASVSDIASQLDAATDATAFADVDAKLKGLEPLNHASVQVIKRLQDKLNRKVQQSQVQNKERDFEALFTALSSKDVALENVPAEYRESFNKQQETQFNRAQLTLALELIANVASPEGEQAQRQQVQLMLLSDKHNQGRELSKESFLKRWLQFGAIDESEQALLQRVKALFI